MNTRATSRQPLPAGFRVTFDPSTQELEPGIWFGGSPSRVMRLTGSGRRALIELQHGAITSAGAGALARRFTDAGLAHPVPTSPDAARDVTVIVPVHERRTELERCLQVLAADYGVVVVDDASADEAGLADVAERHGAKLVRREVNGGAGAARNTGLEHVHSEFVAFLDSDCLPSADWIDRLVGHFADPLVAAVAPRIASLAPDTWAGQYTRAQGSLDLGATPARVAPGSRVSYVPTAALVVRRSALLEVARDGDVFDETMRVGEDVDLIWRLHAAGWLVRFDPSVQVRHQEPATWPGLLARRFRYGTSAAPLANRHGSSVAPLVLHPWSAVTVAALLARRPALAALAFAGSAVSMAQSLRRAHVPTSGVHRALALAARQTWLGAGRYGAQFASPLLVGAMTRGPSGRRASAASLLLGPPLDAWRRADTSLDPVRFTVGWLADQIAYGAGVWTGCVRHRTSVPLRPIVVARPLRSTAPPHQKESEFHAQRVVRDGGASAASREEAVAEVGVQRAGRRFGTRHHDPGQHGRFR